MTRATVRTLWDKCLDNVSCLSVAWVRPSLTMTANWVLSKHSLDCRGVNPVLSHVTDSALCLPLLDRITPQNNLYWRAEKGNRKGWGVLVWGYHAHQLDALSISIYIIATTWPSYLPIFRLYTQWQYIGPWHFSILSSWKPVNYTQIFVLHFRIETHV